MNTKLKKGLIGLGITAAIVGGVAGYLGGGRDYLTYEEYLGLINAYNKKIEEIKEDCDNDKRCIKAEGKKKVIFGQIRYQKDIVKKLDKWIEDDVKNPRAYKK